MNIWAYKDISARIREGAPEILEIDIYNGQYENPDMFNSYNYPAVFVEFDANNWVTNAFDTQEGLGGFKIHVVLPITDQDTRNIDQAAPSDVTARLSVFAIPHKVHKSLQGYQPTGFKSPLERADDLPDHNYSTYFVMVYHYTAIADDDSTGWYEQDNWETTQLTDITVQPEQGD